MHKDLTPRPSPSTNDPVANAATQNLNALYALVRDYGIKITTENNVLTERSEWRATARTQGCINGLEHLGSLTIIATNGVVAYYLLPDVTTTSLGVRDNSKTFFGHVDHFDGEVRPLFSVHKPARAKVGDTADDNGGAKPVRKNTKARTIVVTSAAKAKAERAHVDSLTNLLDDIL